MRARRGAEFSRGLLLPACFSRSGFTGRDSLFKKSEPNVVKGGTQKPAGELAAVDRTIDLFNHGTVRGGSEPNPLDAVSLPSTLVHLRLILPRFSDPGSYVVAVSKDRAGTAIVARGSGKTVADGQRLFLDVSLDLRGARLDHISWPLCERVITALTTIHSTCRSGEHRNDSKSDDHPVGCELPERASSALVTRNFRQCKQLSNGSCRYALNSD